MDLMTVHTAQSPEFIASVHDANARRMAAHQQAAGVRATPPNLLSTDNQRERLISAAMSLRNISLANCTYEMMKTQYHDLFITTRTSIQDPSIRPPGRNRSNTFYIKGFWVEDEEGLEGFMATNDEETFWVLEENDAFIARKVSGRNFRFTKRKVKGKQKG